MHRWVDQEEQWLPEQSFVLRVLQQSVVVGVHRDCFLIEDGACLVEANQALLGVHLTVELEHALRELCVRDDAAIRGVGERAGKARLDVDFAAVDHTQERANDCGLVLRATQVVVKDV